VKRYTTTTLRTIALGYMAFVVMYLLFAALLFDIPVNQCFRVLLSPSYYLLSFFAAFAGYGLWEMKRWAWYLFLAVNVMAIYSNAILVSEFGETHHKPLAFAVSLLVLGLVFLRVRMELKVPYFLPRIRWWESNPKYRFSSPAAVFRKDGVMIEGEILDFTVSGCFVKLRVDLIPNEVVKVKLNVFGYTIECPGLAVWVTQSAVAHPRGAGIKFIALDRSQRRTLRVMSHRLSKVLTLYRTSRYLMSQEEYRKRLEALQSKLVNMNSNDKP
jgi:hypothetical protein